MESGSWYINVEIILKLQHTVTSISIIIFYHNILFSYIFLTRHPPPVTCHPLPLTRHPSPVTHYPSPATHHPLPVTCHPLPVTCHPSSATRHLPPAEKSCRTTVTRVRLATNMQSDRSEFIFRPVPCKRMERNVWRLI